jgi:AraC-like DNA-binding protein
MVISLFIVSLVLSLIMIYHNYETNKNTIYIGCFLIILSLFFITHYLLVNSDSVIGALITFNHFIPLFLLLGPLLYFYLRGVLNDEFIFKKKDLIHFIPAIIYLTSISGYIFIPFDKKIEIIIALKTDINAYVKYQELINPFFSVTFNLFFRVIILLLYILYNVYSLIRYSINKIKYSQVTNNEKWLYVFHILILIIALSYITYLIKGSINRSFFLEESSFNYLIPAIVSMMFINISLLVQPSILYGIPKIRQKVVYDEVLGNPLTESEEPEIDTPENNIEVEYFIELTKRIEQYFMDHKPYVKTDFDLTDLTIALGVPLHHITICFRQYINMKFTDYKNKYRVLEAQHLLKSSVMDNFTIEAIGEQVGFQSKSNFFTSFKKITGQTPLEYKKGL